MSQLIDAYATECAKWNCLEERMDEDLASMQGSRPRDEEKPIELIEPDVKQAR